MSFLPASLRAPFAILLAVAGGMLLPAAASAACSLPGTPVQGGGLDDGLNPADEIVYQGTLNAAVNQNFLQIPFEVGGGVKGMRIRYCYSKLVPADDAPTLDLGLYGPKQPGAANWTMKDLRGWSGSAVRIVGIGENGYSDPTTYNASRKAYVPGRTTRAFRPGPIDPGTWAVELGAGWIPPGGVDFRVGITPSTDAGTWANDPFRPEAYEPYVANPKPGWYQGDVHVHGEQEPGNATMKESLDLAFAPIVPGQPTQGAGLDFVDLVDHNNDFARQVLGASRYRYPGRLVIPGSEITTYRGHMNSQDANRMVDFRTAPIFRFPASGGPGPVTLDQNTLTPVPGSTEPAQLFPEIDALRGWGQLNHPTTFLYSPSACRGCAWTYSDAETGFGNVDAMEIANGIADMSHGGNPPSLNPFTPLAIKLYEQRLAAGDHIAAVASSDDHRAGEGYGTGTDPVIGQGATAVYARELSPTAITEAVRNGYTYAKVFGADAPDVLLTADSYGYRAIPGRSISGRRLKLNLKVLGAADNPRPGEWSLSILRNGTPIRTYPVSGDSFSTEHATSMSGRYSFELDREQGGVKVTEAYSTPIWYTHGRPPLPVPRLSRFKANRKKGTATIRVSTVGAGRVVLKPGAVKGAKAETTETRKTVTLKLVPGAKARRQLRRSGRAKVTLSVSFSSEWTETRITRKTVVLKRKTGKRPGRRR